MESIHQGNLLTHVIGNFNFEGILLEVKPYGNGHINDTYLLDFIVKSNQRRQYILPKN